MSYEKLETKKAIFLNNKIIIKKSNETIFLNDIKCMFYARPTIKNYFSLGFGDWKSIGALYIFLNSNKKRDYRYFFIKYNEVKKIPLKIYNHITFYSPDVPFEY